MVLDKEHPLDTFFFFMIATGGVVVLVAAVILLAGEKPVSPSYRPCPCQYVLHVPSYRNFNRRNPNVWASVFTLIFTPFQQAALP